MSGAAQLEQASRRGHAARALTSLLVIVILLAAASARFHRIGAQSLWYDEGLAYGHSLRSLPELVSHLQPNVHVPAYFTLLGWWRELAGSTEFALRMPSALFSLVGVAWAYALGARLFHPIAGLAAAALVALNSFSIYYAQEARMYAMLTAIGAGSMWLFLGLLRARNSGEREKPGWGRIIALGLVNALGIYTHFAHAFVILVQSALVTLIFFASSFGGGTAAGWRRLPWRYWLRVMMAPVLTLALFLPWLPVAIAQLGNRSHRLQHLPVDQLLAEILGYFAFGSVHPLIASGEATIILFLLIMGLLPTASPRQAWRAALLPIAWAVISIALFLFIGLGHGFLRFLLPAQLAFALWLGRGFWVLWRLPIRRGHPILRITPKLGAAFALALCLAALVRGLGALYHHPDFQRDDMRGLARQIEAELDAGDAIIVSARGLQELLRYYYQGDAPIYPLPSVADEEATKQEVLDIIAAHDRLHVIFYGADQQDPNLIVETTLNRNAFEFADRWIDDLRYARYASPATLGARKRPGVNFGGEIVLDAYALNATVISPGDVLNAQLVWRALQSPRARYKVFLQLLNSDGALVAQRDSEPVAGSSMTTTWQPGDTVTDNHGLLIPADTPAGEYRLIAGLYDINDPLARLPAGDSSYVELSAIEARAAG